MNLTTHRSTSGFSLVEVTLALGVAGFCLVALFGLLPVGVNSNSTSIEQTTAASIAASVVADLRATQVAFTTPSSTDSAVSMIYAIPVPPLSNPPNYTLFLRGDGSLAQVPGAIPTTSAGWDIDPTQNPRYRVTLTFTLPTAAGQLTALPVRVLVTWPAVADAKAGALPSKFAGSFETVTALDHK